MPRPKGSKNASKTAAKRELDEPDVTKVAKKSLPTTSEPQDDLQDETDLIQQFIDETEQQKSEDDDAIDDEFESSDLTTNVVPQKTFAQIVTTGNATEGRCGSCEGCRRKPCRECSSCKRQDLKECIDLYCTNQMSGLTERAAIREMYLQSLKKQQDEMSKDVSVEDDVSEDEDDSRGSDDDDEEEDEDVKDVKPAAATVVAVAVAAASKETKANNAEKKAKRSAGGGGGQNFGVVYGGSSRAAKVRRCGECEGCTRDDCGQCLACMDKPRFGGKGTKKKACAERYCRLKAGKAS